VSRMIPYKFCGTSTARHNLTAVQTDHIVKTEPRILSQLLRPTEPAPSGNWDLLTEPTPIRPSKRKSFDIRVSMAKTRGGRSGSKAPDKNIKCKCDTCGVVVIGQKSLNRHHASIHQDPFTAYKCPLCSEYSNRKETVQRHLQNRHHTSTSQDVEGEVISRATFALHAMDATSKKAVKDNKTPKRRKPRGAPAVSVELVDRVATPDLLDGDADGTVSDTSITPPGKFSKKSSTTATSTVTRADSSESESDEEGSTGAGTYAPMSNQASSDSDSDSTVDQQFLAYDAVTPVPSPGEHVEIGPSSSPMTRAQTQRVGTSRNVTSETHAETTKSGRRQATIRDRTPSPSVCPRTPVSPRRSPRVAHVRRSRSGTPPISTPGNSPTPPSAKRARKDGPVGQSKPGTSAGGGEFRTQEHPRISTEPRTTKFLPLPSLGIKEIPATVTAASLLLADQAQRSPGLRSHAETRLRQTAEIMTPPTIPGPRPAVSPPPVHRALNPNEIEVDFGRGLVNVTVPPVNPNIVTVGVPWGPATYGPTELRDDGLYVSTFGTRESAHGLVLRESIFRIIDIRLDDPRLNMGFYAAPQWRLGRVAGVPLQMEQQENLGAPVAGDAASIEILR
jgi:hypothetical protein